MMHQNIEALGAWLQTTPLLGLILTLLAYQGAMWIHRRMKGHTLANPVLIGVFIVITVLSIMKVDYQAYFQSAQFIHFLLGPVTVALAVPLYAQIKPLVRLASPLLISLTAGALSAIVLVVALARPAGATRETLLALLPKTATAPIAMAMADTLGTSASLVMACVMMTGIVGTLSAPLVFRLLGVQDEAVRGFALGLTAHGIGTARAFQESERTGAFAALAMGLTGLLTALIVPPLALWLAR
ncbi:MAG: LrgB family protein [Lautropia sp.]|nr:LrgB family protein [Lautropia sp.]